MKTAKVVAWVLCAVLLTTAFAPVPTLGKEEPDELPDIAENQTPAPKETSDIEHEVDEEHDIEKEEREIEIKVETDRVEIKAKNYSETEPGRIEDEIKLRVDTDEGVEFRLEFSTEFELADNVEIEREIELEFEAEFDSIVEFVDNDNDGVYDPGEAVYTYDLKHASFAPLQYTVENVNGVQVHKITVQTTDGVFKAILYSSGQPVTLDGENITPNEAKITVEINNFPYTRTDSKLALKTELKSEREIEEEVKSKEFERETEIEIKSGGFGGFFSWKDTALVDGVERPVLSTELIHDVEEGDRELYLIYERGTSIVHDPKIGVLGAIGLVQVIPWLTVLAAAIVAALISIAATRQIVLRRY